MTSRRRILGALLLGLLCLPAFGAEERQSQQVASTNRVFALEGLLKVHPKFLFKHYLTGFGDGQECALFGEEIEKITPGSWIRVEGTLGTRFHHGGTATNPSPFPKTCFIYMDVHTVKVLREPEK